MTDRDPVTGASPPASEKGSRGPSAIPAPKRVSRLYFVIGGICVLLLLVIIFVAQNSSAVPVHIFVWRFHLALGLTMLLSAVVGGLLVLLTTGFRILHLRRRAGAAHKRSEAQPPATGAETVTIISSSPATGTVPSPEQGPPSS